MSEISELHPYLEIYIRLMTQLKERLNVVDLTMVMVGKGEYYAGPLAGIELSLLQLRLCCELLALGCIAIHSDVTQSSRLKNEWNAGKIIKAFERLKPTYFPTSVSPDATPHITHRTDGVLTKSDLLTMYNFFGNHLHAGRFMDHLHPPNATHETATLNEFVKKLKALLSVHVYTLYGENRLVRIVMQDKITGDVGYNVFQAIGRLKVD